MKKYQIFITDNFTQGRMKSFSFSSRHLKILVGCFALFLLVLGIVTFDYSMAVFRHEQVRELRVENEELERHLNIIKSKVSLLESNVSKVEDFSLRLKVITNKDYLLTDDAIGPLPMDGQPTHFSPPTWRERPTQKNFNGETKKINFTPVEKERSTQLEKENKTFEGHISHLLQKTETLQRDIWIAIGSIEEQKHLLRVTPNTLPSRGRITSRFGYRGGTALPFIGTDATFHSIAHFHKGIDIASEIGTPIHAPADGVVVMTGYDAMTGNYIYINHGYDLDTLYAHLDQVKVEPFSVVKRGDMIGAIGNTGRSTGPHLHYEVRIAGQSVDPEYFFFGF